MLDEWEQEIQDEINRLREIAEIKASKSSVDVIEQQQMEKIRQKRKSSFQQYQLLDPNTDNPERIVKESVDAGDLDTAFSTFCRYVERISNLKADSLQVQEKATTRYVTNLFDRLKLLNLDLVKETTDQLQEEILGDLQELACEFDQVSKSIIQQVTDAEDDIMEIMQDIESFGLQEKKRKQPQYDFKRGLTAPPRQPNSRIALIHSSALSRGITRSAMKSTTPPSDIKLLLEGKKDPSIL